MQVFPPTTVQYALPLNDKETEDRWYVQQGYLGHTHTLPAVNLLRYSNCYVNPFGVAFRRHRLIRQTVYPMTLRDGRAGQFVKSYWKNRVKGRVAAATYDRVALVQHPWLANYYHFTCEVLPRLYLMRDRLADCTLLLPKSERRPFHDAYLGLFNIGEVRWVTENMLYRAKELWVPDFSNPYGIHHPELFEQLRDFLHVNLGITNNKDKGIKCIYISRENAPKRRLQNEAPLMQLLQQRGFEVTRTEELSVHEQAALFSETGVAVGLNGAAWSNLLYMHPGSLVVNLVNKTHPEFVFYSLASVLGINVLHVPCDGDGTKRYAGSQDVRVDVEKLTTILDTYALKKCS